MATNYKKEIKELYQSTNPEYLKLALQRLNEKELTSDITESSKRRMQALDSFQCFLDTYFSHYFTTSFGPQQLALVELIQSLKNRQNREAMKFSRAVSRGFGKSTIITLCGVLWMLLRDDWKFVLLISASMPHAEGFLRKISDEAEDNELLNEDFEELKPAIDRNGTTVAWNDRHLVFDGGFAIIAKGFGNKIRGLRYKNYRPDAVVIDDPDEYSDIESETTMQRRYRWLERSVLQTGSVLHGLDVILVYTTISENCTGEYIYANKSGKFNKFNRKKYKALEKLEDDTYISNWEEGAPVELLLDEKDKDPLAFASERQNEPLAEAGQCFRGLVQTYEFQREEDYTGWRFALGVDESLGRSERSNPSAIIGVAMSPTGVMYEVYSAIKIRRPDQIIADLLPVLLLFPWERCGIDTSGNQEHFLDRVQDAIQEYNKNNPNGQKILVPLVGLKDSVNKSVRIETALQPLVAGGLIKIRQDSKVLLEQIESFPFGKIDGPDALEYAVRLLKTGVGVHEISAISNATRSSRKVQGRTGKQILRARLKRLGVKL